MPTASIIFKKGRHLKLLAVFSENPPLRPGDPTHDPINMLGNITAYDAQGDYKEFDYMATTPID